MDLKDLVCEGVTWINLASGPVVGCF